MLLKSIEQSFSKKTVKIILKIKIKFRETY